MTKPTNNTDRGVLRAIAATFVIVLGIKATNAVRKLLGKPEL